MKEKQIVGITIPIYKPVLSDDEVLSLRQCIKVLKDYPIIFCCPPQLDTSAYVDACKDKIAFRVEHFDEAYFRDIKGYNRLMLSTLFYERFSDYKYILIYQLDAWIFENSLAEWCAKGYDYIGAPWINWDWVSLVAGHMTVPRTILTKLGYKKFNLVGNGGLSLRKTSSCIKNLKFLKKAVANFEYNEDYFFSFYINSYNPFFRIPSAQEALKFSFDINPEESFELNQRQLPMGCHAWPKYKEFWKHHVPCNEPVE